MVLVDSGQGFLKPFILELVLPRQVKNIFVFNESKINFEVNVDV